MAWSLTCDWNHQRFKAKEIQPIVLIANIQYESLNFEVEVDITLISDHRAVDNLSLLYFSFFSDYTMITSIFESIYSKEILPMHIF